MGAAGHPAGGCARPAGPTRCRGDGGAVVLGYATLPEPAIREGVRRLAEAVAEVRDAPASPPPTAATVAALMTLA